MARVTITIEDADDGLAIELESDPPLPLATITDPRHLAELGGYSEDLDLSAATTAQAAARLAVGEVMGSSRTAKLITREA